MNMYLFYLSKRPPLKVVNPRNKMTVLKVRFSQAVICFCTSNIIMEC